MEVLQKEVKLSMKAAFSKGTSKNLKIQWRSYLLFCQFHGLKAIPATVETLCVYAQFLIRSFSQKLHFRYQNHASYVGCEVSF